MGGRRRGALIAIVVGLVVVALAVQRLGPPRGAGPPAGPPADDDRPAAAPVTWEGEARPAVARAEVADEGTVITGWGADGAPAFEMTIGQWQAFADEHLEQRLAEEVRIGDQVIPPSAFDRFGAAAAAPGGDRVVFTATAYAMLTTVSIVTVLRLADEGLELVREPVYGGVQELTWSPDARYVGYAVATARAGGQRLRIDDLDTLRMVTELAAQDVLAASEEAGHAVVVDLEDFEPGFRDLTWEPERPLLLVTTADPGLGEARGALRWLVRPAHASLAPIP